MAKLTFEQYLLEDANVPEKLTADISDKMSVKESDLDKVVLVGDLVKFTIKSGPKKGVYIADVTKSGNMILPKTVEKI